MASDQDRRRYARSKQAVGNVSRHAQQRVDERVMEIMSRRDAAEHRDPPADESSRRFSRRPVTSRG